MHAFYMKVMVKAIFVNKFQFFFEHKIEDLNVSGFVKKAKTRKAFLRPETTSSQSFVYG